MEKLLYGIIAVLWTVLVGASAFAGDVRIPNPAESDLVSASSALVTPVRAAVMDANLRPAVQLGNGSGAEIFGALIVGGLLLRNARRRRLL
ncbi:MAG TPA: hypothetical protein VF595_16945 [Tepidisphaeraceae bacterium]|jgi:ABC-type cobalamin transport system permease subunit